MIVRVGFSKCREQCLLFCLFSDNESDEFFNDMDVIVVIKRGVKFTFS